MLGGDGLMCANGAEGNNDLIVHGVCVEEKGSNNALESLDTKGIERRTGVGFRGILDVGTVCDFRVLV